jgi:hypothetical protein
MKRKLAIAIAIGLSATMFVLGLYIAHTPGNIAVVIVVVSLSTWRDRKQRTLWATVWRLRQASIEDRSSMLATLEPPKLREKVRAILAQDGSNQAERDIERFPFPLGLRRLATRAYWTTWALGLVVLATISTVPDTLPGLRYFLFAILILCVYAAWRTLQRERSYDTVIEVTPFRVSELLPDGRTRTLLLRGSLVLHHEPKRKRLRVSPNEHDPGIVLDFRLMGFDRLVDLIVAYGGFRELEERERLPDSRSKPDES